jgi:hypothetical protein
MRIFIPIPSSGDPELGGPTEDCLDPARLPEQLRLGRCWRDGLEEVAKAVADPLTHWGPGAVSGSKPASLARELGWDQPLALYGEAPQQDRSLEAKASGNAGRVLDHIAHGLAEYEECRRAIPEPSPRIEHRRLCVGMATFDDFDGVWSTIQSIRFYQPEVLNQVSFLVVDNHPDGPSAEHLKELDQKVPQLRYVPFSGFRSTAVRDLVFREADADVVLCLDCHVLLRPGALGALIEWFDEHPDSRDLVQGPMLADDFSAYASHFTPSWGAGMYGQWALDQRATDPKGAPFEIEMQGLGAFACRREAWVGINPRFRGFGGEEGYLHEKFRRAGGRVVCHPALGWHHRFPRPDGPPYPNIWEDRIRNYLIGWRELGWDISAIATHFRELLGDGQAHSILSQTRRQLASPFDFFDAVFCLNLEDQAERWQEMARRFQVLDIAWRVERVPAVRALDPYVGHTQSFRGIVAEASRREYRNVLILEDDALFLDSTIDVMRAAVDDLARREWDLLYLGASVWSQSFPFATGSTVLQVPRGITSMHAVAVNDTAFERILAELPVADDPGYADWQGEFVATDQYLSHRIDEGAFRAFLVWPRVATQPVLRNYAEADLALADRYVI